MTLSSTMSAFASGVILTWQARRIFPTVMAHICSSWVATTSSISNSPLSSFVASISLGVLSIRTSSMFRRILIVVPKTMTENISVQIKSTISNWGLNHMIPPPIITPILWMESPSTWR
ncbi:hypothetical protein PanWU01x14_014190 [Parasponia andersonii]|uniref:Uncharacterized protein n=1 Tax=Parasponia andersonii TaxID=3476 RepID=A0A2P5E049_PARAD|nr:hypothetical protein PanWU01x14_014190 [Parasponia andersonii]